MWRTFRVLTRAQQRARVLATASWVISSVAAFYCTWSMQRGTILSRLGKLCRTSLPLMVRALRKSPSRSEEHTSELQSLMRISYAVFCLKKKRTKNREQHRKHTEYDIKLPQ